MPRRDLTDNVIVITGASAGIGRATAIACAQAGMDVVVSARRVERLDEVVSEIESHGRRGLAVVCDVASDDHVGELFNATLNHFNRLDAVLANAGVGLERPAAELDDASLREIFEINFYGTMRVVRAAVQIFRRQRHGHVLITSSCLARFTLPYYSAYSATKAAQTHIARAMRMELAPEGIDVSVVHPITTVTEFFDATADRSGVPRNNIPDHAPRLFIQPPQRVARAIVRCLRRPKPEVWTSVIVRLVAGAFVAFPRFHDLCLRREARRRRAVWLKHGSAAVHPADEFPSTQTSRTTNPVR
jgi:short-subunit dehydrogenase